MSKDFYQQQEEEARFVRGPAATQKPVVVVPLNAPVSSELIDACH